MQNVVSGKDVWAKPYLGHGVVFNVLSLQIGLAKTHCFFVQ